MGCVVTQTRSRAFQRLGQIFQTPVRAFQTLGRAFDFLLKFQKLGRMSERLIRVF